MQKLFENSDQIILKDQKINKKLDINLISQLTTKFGITYLCYNKKHNCSFYANSQLKSDDLKK